MGFGRVGSGGLAGQPQKQMGFIYRNYSACSSLELSLPRARTSRIAKSVFALTKGVGTWVVWTQKSP